MENRNSQPLIASILLATALTLTLVSGAFATSGHSRAPLDSLFVSTTGAGTSCTQIKPCSLATAMSQAVDGDRVVIAGGVYTGSGAEVIAVTENVHLTGGWDGNSGWLVVDPEVYKTILDGEDKRRVVSISGNPRATLDGLIIRGGWHKFTGGGIYIQDGRITISHCQVVHNDGGERGGGIYIASGVVTIENNTISRNSSTLDGAGIHVESGTVDILQNSITFNGSPDEGGGIYVESGTVNVDDNDISNNTAGNAGGGMKLADGLVLGAVGGNRFAGNQASLGSALITDRAAIRFHDNVVMDNEGLCALVFSHQAGDVTRAWNNIVARNEQAALLVEGGTAHLTHNTIADHPLSAIAVDLNAKLVAINNIIARIADGSGSIQIWNGTLVANRNLFWANAADPNTGTDPLFGDPRFRDRPRGDYHLLSGSAAIDLGVDMLITSDIDGQARPHGPAPDVGADEYYSLVYLPILIRRAE